MAFTNFMCLFLVVRGPADDGPAGCEAGRRNRAGGAHGRQSPAHVHKNAVGRRECTGPQPFGQNTSLNPNSAQLK